GDYYETHYYNLMAQKLGFQFSNKETIKHVDTLLDIMESHHLDYTETFVQLTYEDNPNFFPDQPAFRNWKRAWQDATQKAHQPKALMKRVNPVIIPRNHIVKAVLDDASTTLDMSRFHQFLNYLKAPYDITIPKAFRQSNPSDTPFVTTCGT
ncbi:MAG: protein adenylyltransferase SelO family protein, partial [Bacillota bacterium]